MYTWYFTFEYPVTSTIYIILSNNNIVEIVKNELSKFTYGSDSFSISGLSFTNDSQWELQIEDDTYVYKY